MAFSSLLILASMDLIIEWLIKPFKRSTDKVEWLVAPAIIIFAFTVGLLPAVALGIALSTFFFVAAFYRSGVVKFISNGLNVHSTIGRNVADGECEFCVLFPVLLDEFTQKFQGWIKTET